MENLLDKLKNPVWHALTESQTELGISAGDFKYYKPEYTPFSAFHLTSPKADDLLKYARLQDCFFIVGNDLQEVPERLKKIEDIETFQMVLKKLDYIPIIEEVVPLNGKFENDLKELIGSIQPGFFKERTADMGGYYGIFKDGKLVSVAGERIKLKGLAEVSGVVTHFDYSGNGYSQQLIHYVSRQILDRGEVPFLHVSVKNERAVGLYEYLGFEKVGVIGFHKYALK